MKNNKILLTVTIFTLHLFVISCKKYLEKKPNNTLNVPVSITDLQALLDDASVMNLNLTPGYGQASTDDYFLLQSSYDTRDDKDKDIYRWIPPVYSYSNDWSRAYTAIYNANYCLEMLERIPMTSQNEAAWKNIKGSALFYRAFNFLNLVWIHGKAYDENTSNTDLGIVLRRGSDFNVPSVRASVSESYDQVISDATECVSYIPDIPLHSFRPSKVAAYGLLARTYLSMRRYDDALNFANLCLQIKSDLIDCKVNNTSDFATPGASFPFKQFNKETIFYTEMSFTTVTILTVSRAKIDTFLKQSYDTATDIRKDAFFQASSGYHSFKGSYSQSGSYFTGIAVDEMYLTRAECYARKGDKTSAMNDLNVLLTKRHTGAFVPLDAPDAADALNKILIERRKELLFRGLRWMDIKRLNKEGANIVLKRFISGQTYTLLPNANYYALPLPTDIINLTGMPQNPE